MDLEFALLCADDEDIPAAENFERELPVPVTRFGVTDGELPPDGGGEFDAAVITGSWASVYWDLDWLPPLKNWVSTAIECELPIFGVCFGFQLLADVLGGEIANRDAYELGFHQIEHADDSRLFEGIDQEFLAFTSHSDDVTAIPLGGRRLAENQYSAHAFRRDHVFGVQFHPEVDLETARALTAEREPSQERCPDAMATVSEENYRASKQSTLVLENFVAYVREQQSSRP